MERCGPLRRCAAAPGLRARRALCHVSASSRRSPAHPRPSSRSRGRPPQRAVGWSSMSSASGLRTDALIMHPLAHGIGARRTRSSPRRSLHRHQWAAIVHWASAAHRSVDSGPTRTSIRVASSRSHSQRARAPFIPSRWCRHARPSDHRRHVARTHCLVVFGTQAQAMAPRATGVPPAARLRGPLSGPPAQYHGLARAYAGFRATATASRASVSACTAHGLDARYDCVAFGVNSRIDRRSTRPCSSSPRAAAGCPARAAPQRGALTRLLRPGPIVVPE